MVQRRWCKQGVLSCRCRGGADEVLQWWCRGGASVSAEVHVQSRCSSEEMMRCSGGSADMDVLRC